LRPAAARASRDTQHGLRASELGLIELEDWNRRTNRMYLRRLKGSISQDYLLTSE